MKNLFSRLTVFTLLGFFALTFIQCGSDVDVESTKDAINNNSAAVNNNAQPNVNPATNPQVNPVNTNANQPATAQVDPATATEMSFNEMEYDFGTIQEGEKVSHVFKFKNTGDKPLTITNAKGSCGCTVPEYPKTAVAPGDEAEIKVEFNSKGKKGAQTKFVTLDANTIPAQTRLTIKADVVATATK
jgi:hypothetical protein